MRTIAPREFAALPTGGTVSDGLNVILLDPCDDVTGFSLLPTVTPRYSSQPVPLDATEA